MQSKGLMLTGLSAWTVLSGWGCATGRLPVSMIENAAMLPADGEIEIQVSANGEVREIEYHIDQSMLPIAVINAANKKFVGGRIVDCEKEYVDGRVYYEVTKAIEGKKYEGMFTSDGKPYMLEITIDESDTPENVIRAAHGAVAGGLITSVEQIMDGPDKLREYHIKKNVDGRKYKILIRPDGGHIETYREIPAEIEIPARP